MPENSEKHDTQPIEPVSEHDAPAAAAPRQGSGCGCWLTGLTTLVVAAVLVVVGLFLPPINLYDRLFGEQYAMLSPEANAVAADGMTLAVYGPDYGSDFGVVLNSVPLQTFLSGSASAGEWVPQALASVPPTLALQSPIYTVSSTGTQPETVTLSIDVPAEVGDVDIVDVYAWEEATDTWHFLPSHASGGMINAEVRDLPDKIGLFQAAPPDQASVLVSVDVAQVLSPDVAQVANIVAPAGLQPTLEGKLTGSLAAGFDLNAGYLVLPSLRNYSDPRAVDPTTVEAILSSSSLRSEHAAQIAAFAASGYDGVLIDYRDLPAELRPHFSAFITELSRSLKGAGLLLGVVVPAAENQAGSWETGAYDWRALGQAVDFLQINLNLDPTTFAPGEDRVVEAMLRWAVGEVSRSKIYAGLSALSLRQSGSQFTAIGYDQALSALGDVEIDAETSEAGTIEPGTAFEARLDGYRAVSGVDVDSEQPFLDYLNEADETVARMWLTTPESLQYRMNRTGAFAIAGIAFDDLMNNGVANGVLETILNYKLSIPSQPAQRELALRWSIEGSDGSLLGEVTTGLNDALVATVDAPDGNYAVNVEVVSGSSAQVARGGAAVAVFAPTLTPTPIPTATPTPVPQPTAAPVVQQAAPAAVAAAPAAGSIVGGSFEYGGHVTSTATGAADAMRRAGMNWMKVQIRYGQGADPGIAAGAIGDAHARGFKVLLGVVGSPGELAAGGGGYMAQFASFLGGVASLGPDAIEVWNEPNIDREWPTGQISGSMYAQMLQQAYAAIKGANGGVMVISGAPAPTGAEAAFPGQVMNDDRWLSEVVAAGGLQWMDCVGAHYNEGIVSATARGGDPRDNYYTRYFGTMLDTYWNIVGGQRPICFTELGYLSSEGYGPLPDYFAWASNVSVSQQAAWLAEAAALSSQSGRVRLMIVWNVDFTLYGSDPQAGYAMIRPGGGCPACDALAGAR